MVNPRTWPAFVGCILSLALVFSASATATTFQAQSRQELSRIEAEIRASQFLSRATFGPTKAEIQSLATRVESMGPRAAFEEWIDAQFAVAPMLHHPLAKQMIGADGFPGDSVSPPDYSTGSPSTVNYRHYAWWHAAIAAPDQLRQRMAWALSQIFVINEFDANGSSALDPPNNEPKFLGVVDYYDMLLENAFGNYRKTLEDVTYHPIMGDFLSHRGNRKAPDPVNGPFPDENYAREIMQLFSIGLYEIKRNGDYVTDKQTRDPVPSYDNDDIENFARVFTGLDYFDYDGNGSPNQNYHEPMSRFEVRHDTDQKVLLKGTVLPAGQSAEKDIDDALDNLFNHPNTAPFISRLLIQRLVKSNPSSRYIDAVASAFENNGAGVRGDFKAVLKQILLNSEAMDSYTFSANRKNLTLKVEGGGTEHSRLQEPVVRYAAFIRAFDAAPVLIPGGVEESYLYFSIPNRSGQLNQEVYRSPSVFNFYQYDHVPQGELQHYRPQGRFPNKTISAPEFEIMTSVAANTLANTLRSDVLNQQLNLTVSQCCTPDPETGEPKSFGVPLKIRLDFSEEIALAGTPDALLQHLNVLICGGTLNDASRNDLASVIAAATTDNEVRAEGAILALLTAPDCVVHE